jgi:hypothetical protein
LSSIEAESNVNNSKNFRIKYELIKESDKEITNSVGYLYLLGYNALQSFESQPTFRGTYRLNVQGGRIIQVRNQGRAGTKKRAAWLIRRP